MTIEVKKAVPYVCPACHEKRPSRGAYHDCCIEPRGHYGPHRPCADPTCPLCTGQQAEE